MRREYGPGQCRSANLVDVPTLLPADAKFAYANEADLLNVALFGITAKQWRERNPHKDGNMRDNASVEQLIVLTNLESLNAYFIQTGLPPDQRLRQLNETAVSQMKTLTRGRTPSLPGSAG